MARDLFDLRTHRPVTPTDVDDPPRFGQAVETAKDALVAWLREFFTSSQLTASRREELPTIEKYAIHDASLDPYATFAKITEDWPDVAERMPHVAVTGASGSNRRMGIGGPFVGAVQAPPRIVTANVEPYALSVPTAQVTRLDIVSLPGGGGASYTVTIDGTAIATALLPSGTNATQVAAAVRDVLRPVVDPIIEVTASAGATAAVTLRVRAVGEAHTVTTSANLTPVVVSAASVVVEPDRLDYRTTPNGHDVVVSSVVFAASRFATPGTASAADIARVFNEQALYATARVTSAGGVQFETGGRLAPPTPNEVEVLASSTPAIVTALGLADSGIVGAGASITGEAPDMIFNLPSGSFTAAYVGRYLVLGADAGTNAGRWLITAAAPTQLTFTHEAGVAGALADTTTWFVGARDTWLNPARPALNRYHQAEQLTVTLDILAESAAERRELRDLVMSLFVFFLEDRFFVAQGRSSFDETILDETYQVVVHQEVQDGGQQDGLKRSGDEKPFFGARIAIPLTVFQYLDREVTVATGPAVGTNWTLLPGAVTPDDTLPGRS